MFRLLNHLLNKKLKDLTSLKDKEIKIEKYFWRFLEENFKKHTDFKNYFKLVYKISNKTLIITAKNKAIANELSFRTNDLTETLKKSGIAVNQIVIK